MGKAQSNAVFSTPIGSSFFFSQRRKWRGEALEIPVLNSVAQLRLKFIADAEAAGQDKKGREK